MSSPSAFPDTMPDPETGRLLARGVRDTKVEYKGLFLTVAVPGYYPVDDGEGDGVLVGDDMMPIEAALHILKEQVDGVPAPATIRRIRQRVKLSQREAGRLLRVGENAFHKYERGIAVPSGPTVALLQLLDRRPELVEELRRSNPAI